MFNLARQEKIVLLVIILIILLIIGLRIYTQEQNAITIVPAVDSIESSIEKENIQEEICIVHISGAVSNPGVYQLNGNKRIIDVVKIAGGELENANVDAVNLAAHIFDGQKIVIPFLAENSGENNNQNVLPNNNPEQYGYSSQNNLVNLNTATSSQLEDLPGIGPVLAKSILEYRQKYGQFRDIADIKNVGGIGEKRFESIKEYITVY
jgi:competence protein ComEA